MERDQTCVTNSDCKCELLSGFTARNFLTALSDQEWEKDGEREGTREDGGQEEERMKGGKEGLGHCFDVELRSWPSELAAASSCTSYGP